MKTFLGIVFMFVVLGVVWVTPWYLSSFLGYGQAHDASEYGQQFGAVSAVFSGLAFLGVAFAVLFQKGQLDTTKKTIDPGTEASRAANVRKHIL